jgi:hypothetical protein
MEFTCFLCNDRPFDLYTSPAIDCYITQNKVDTMSGTFCLLGEKQDSVSEVKVKLSP